MNFEYSDYALTRPCKTCGSKRVRSKTGNIYCKVCARARRKKWGEAHQEEARKSSMEASRLARSKYTKEDRARIAAAKRNKLATDPIALAAHKEAQKRWKDKNKEHIKAYDIARAKRLKKEAKIAEYGKKILVYPTPEELVKIDLRNDRRRELARKRYAEKKGTEDDCS